MGNGQFKEYPGPEADPGDGHCDALPEANRDDAVADTKRGAKQDPEIDEKRQQRQARAEKIALGQISRRSALR